MMFNKSQYLTEEELSDLIGKVRWSREDIQSWFRVSRALANVFDVEKADPEEMVNMNWRKKIFHKCCQLSRASASEKLGLVWFSVRI